MPAEIHCLMKEIDKFKENIANSDELLNSLKSVDKMLAEHNATHLEAMSCVNATKNIVENCHVNSKTFFEKFHQQIVDIDTLQKIVLSEIIELKNITANNKSDIEKMVVAMQTEQSSKFNFLYKSIIFLIILASANFIAIFVLFSRILV